MFYKKKKKDFRGEGQLDECIDAFSWVIRFFLGRTDQKKLKKDAQDRNSKDIKKV